MTTTALPPSPAPASPTAPFDRAAAAAAVRRVPTWWRDTSFAAFWLINLFVVALWVGGGGLTGLGSLGGALTSLGRVTGLIASALLLIQVFLMARIPWFEQAWGQDKLTRIHRVVGFTSFNLLWAHIVLITAGYAADSSAGLWGTIVDFTLNYPGMLLAIAGTLALCLVVATSVKKARGKLRYESWHLIHLYGYLGAGLALPHQLWTGADFLSSTVATVFWWSLYAVCLAAVLIWRVGVPAWRSLRHPIRVVSTRLERDDVITVTVEGRGVERFAAAGGQFFNWRFRSGTGWTRANPFSLSAAPQGNRLRFTAAMVGDGTRNLATLEPGTRVLLEGPYGRMHAGVREQPKVLMLAAGIGVTPMRALLEAMPQRPGEVTLVHRVSRMEDLLLSHELDELAKARGARYVVVEGRRVPGRESWLPASAAHLSDVQGLLHLCPDVAERDVFICGAPAWMVAATRAVEAAGVPAERIHCELFEY